MQGNQKMETLLGERTMREIDWRIPDALRLTFGIPYRATPPPAPGQHDEMARFATAQLPPRADPMECDDDDDDAAPPPRATRGASTAVILSLCGRALKWAYVGDSGFAVFRDGRLLKRSRPQQHYFDCPFQLSFEAGRHAVERAAVGEMPAREGDVVVVGTDGLFDNVSDDELERIVRMGTAQGFTPRNMGEVIAAFAYEASRCAGRDTPFSVLSRKEAGTTNVGGKPDDITVVVAFIVSFLFDRSITCF